MKIVRIISRLFICLLCVFNFMRAYFGVRFKSRQVLLKWIFALHCSSYLFVFIFWFMPYAWLAFTIFNVSILLCNRKYNTIFQSVNTTYRLTYLLTYSWSWALLEKLPFVQPLKNFPAFYGTRRFITAFTRALHWSLSWARSIQSPHPILSL
jgi:hypothetical protein